MHLCGDCHRGEGSPVLTQEPEGGLCILYCDCMLQYMQVVLRAEKYCMEGTAITTSIWKKKPCLVLYLKRANSPPGYKLKFNTGPREERDFHAPPLFSLANLGSLFLKMPAHINPAHRYWTGTAGHPAAGGRCSEGMGMSVVGPLGFLQCSLVCSPVCFSWKLWSPQNSSGNKTIRCSPDESSAKSFLC